MPDEPGGSGVSPEAALSGAAGAGTVAPPQTTRRSPAQATTALSRTPRGEAGSAPQRLGAGAQAAPPATVPPPGGAPPQTTTPVPAPPTAAAERGTPAAAGAAPHGDGSPTPGRRPAGCGGPGRRRGRSAVDRSGLGQCAAVAGGRSRGGHLVAAPPGVDPIARAQDPEGGGHDHGRGDGGQDPDPGAPGRGVPPRPPPPPPTPTGRSFCGTEGRPRPMGRNGPAAAAEAD